MIKGYTELTTVFNGAEEYCAEYRDDIPKEQQEMENVIAETQRFAYDNSDATVAIYKLHHPHEQGIQCECVQYINDHNPYWERKGQTSEK